MEDEFEKVNEAATFVAHEAGNMMIDLCGDKLEEISGEHEVSRGSYVDLIMLALVKMSGAIVETACRTSNLGKRDKEFFREKFLDMVQEHFDSYDRMTDETTFSVGLN